MNCLMSANYGYSCLPKYFTTASVPEATNSHTEEGREEYIIIQQITTLLLS